MTPLDECLDALIVTIRSESDALARQDHAAAASLLDAKTTLSATLQRHLSAGTEAAGATTAALVTRLLEAIVTNRAQLECAIRVRGQMLGLLRQVARRAANTGLYSKSGPQMRSAQTGRTTFMTRA